MKSAIATLIAALLLASCASTGNRPTNPERGPGWYTVKRTDTLYSIAWRYGLDYHQLAQWNQIAANEPIYPGQRLRLLKPHRQATPGISAGASSSSSGGTDTGSSSASSSSKSASKSKTTSAAAGESVAMKNPLKWIWPTAGKPLNTFLASQLDRRGIDIAGKQGQPVLAVADGRVVYSGNGLAGYGNLIIIKHSDTYLSAYAYCRERLVEEGMAVKAGKLVARMGQRDNVAKLHFEIRRNGKPVDPLKYLPKQ
ncbi:MAG: peptidoglycan DD-metalloendopeptidase family protein [Gammaproteobacteria bacterium]|nr:peptidoglycan DD-metalloendopeptidase family protein [Gammaproteobacteria bacterium]